MLYWKAWDDWWILTFLKGFPHGCAAAMLRLSTYFKSLVGLIFKFKNLRINKKKLLKIPSGSSPTSLPNLWGSPFKQWIRSTNNNWCTGWMRVHTEGFSFLFSCGPEKPFIFYLYYLISQRGTHLAECRGLGYIGFERANEEITICCDTKESCLN